MQNYSREETIQGRKLYEEIWYIFPLERQRHYNLFHPDEIFRCLELSLLKNLFDSFCLFEYSYKNLDKYMLHAFLFDMDISLDLKSEGPWFKPHQSQKKLSESAQNLRWRFHKILRPSHNI